MKSLYHYRPLEHTDSIRLITLHPASDPSCPIRCSIHHVRLHGIVETDSSDPESSGTDESDGSKLDSLGDDGHEPRSSLPDNFGTDYSTPNISKPVNPVYEAISYTWGEDTSLFSILVDHDWSELSIRTNCYNMLHHFRCTDRDRVLWIDAICINQADLNERSHQVKSMDKIYEHASRVVVHLGEESPETRMLFEELAEADMELKTTGECQRSHPNSSIVDALEQLVQRPWFRRVWTLQEVNRNPSILFMCGSYEASLQALDKCLHGYEQDRLITKTPRPLAFDIGPKWQVPLALPQLGLWDNLLRTRGFLATDPRDKVYALRSLLLSKRHRAATEHLIDYTISVEEAFVNTALFLMEAIGLQVLVALRHPHELAMPSWVPEFSATLPVDTSGLYGNFGRTEHMAFDIDLPSGHQEFPRLRFKALRLATIRKSGRVYYFEDMRDATSQMHKLERCIRDFSSSANMDVNRYWNREQHSADVEDAEGMRILRSLAIYQMVHLLSDVRRDHFGHIIPTPELSFYDSLQQCKIAVTDTRDIAIVPDTAQAGDVICLPSGCNHLFLLRRDSERYWRLISGDCYLFRCRYLEPDGEYSRWPCHHSFTVHEADLEEYIIS